MRLVRWLGVMLCFALLCSQTVAAAPTEETVHAVGVIADFNFSNENAVVEENIEVNGYGDKDKGYNATTGDGDLYASVDGQSYRKLEWTKDGYSGVGIQPAMTGGARHPWGEGAFLEVRLSTVGWYDLTFSAQLGATNKGPRDFQLQYSLDGKSYTDIGDVYSLSDNKVMEKAFRAVPLPEEAQNADMLYIRIAVVGNETVGGMQGFVGTTSGEVAINAVTVAGSYDRELAQAGETAPSFPWIPVAIGAGVIAVAAVAIVAVIVGKRRKVTENKEQ